MSLDDGSHVRATIPSDGTQLLLAHTVGVPQLTQHLVDVWLHLPATFVGFFRVLPVYEQLPTTTERSYVRTNQIGIATRNGKREKDERK